MAPDFSLIFPIFYFYFGGEGCVQGFSEFFCRVPDYNKRNYKLSFAEETHQFESTNSYFAGPWHQLCTDQVEEAVRS